MNGADEFRAALRGDIRVATWTLTRPGTDNRWIRRYGMTAQLEITPEATQFIRNKGGRAVIDLICWKG